MTNGHFGNCITPSDCWCETRLYAGVFALGVVILVGQIVGGILSGSLALLADSGHVFVDNLALVFTMITAYMVKKNRNHEHTIRAIGGYLNAVLLFIVGMWVLTEAIERFHKPVYVESLVLIAFASLGGMGNWWQHELVKHAPHTEHTVTAKSARLHILSDFWQSVAVVFGGIVIYFTEWFRVDTILSATIAMFMFYWAVQIFRLSRKEGNSHEHHGHHRH